MLTYIYRAAVRLLVEKKLDLASKFSPDFLTLQLKISIKDELLYLVNKYNIPNKSIQMGKAVQILMENPTLFEKNSIIRGDMNLDHTD